MPGDPPCHFYVQLVQPAPAKKLQKIYKKFKVSKKYSKKPKNPSKNFLTIRLASN